MSVTEVKPDLISLTQHSNAFLGLLWKTLLHEDSIASYLQLRPPIWRIYHRLEFLSLEKILDKVTPFLWNSIFELYEASPQNYITAINKFSINLVDSFGPSSLKGNTIKIEKWSNKVVCFPKQGLYASTLATAFELINSENQLCLRVAGKEIECVPMPFKQTLQGKFGYVFAPDSHTVFDANEPVNIDTEINILSFRNQINNGLKLIRTMDKQLAEQVQKSITCYIPVCSAHPKVHHSFSTSSFPGIIFLSATKNQCSMAEAVIHEFGHTELDRIFSFENIDNGTAPGLFYSPWREDPRPLKGLFHAVYVFHKIYTFYAKINLSEIPKKDAEFISVRIKMVLSKLFIGIQQIPIYALSEVALSIFNYIHQDIIKRKRALSEVPFEIKQTANLHLTTWLKRNTNLEIKEHDKIMQFIRDTII